MSSVVPAKQQASGSSITIIGAGNDGQISISPQMMDFGTITVGFAKTLPVTITNKGNCNVYIELRMVTSKGENVTEARAKEIETILRECFHFDNHKGIVNAKSKKKVNITFKPNCRFEFDTTLVCYAREKMAKDLNATASVPSSMSQVEKDEILIRCKGDFPLIRFTDVRND